GRMLMMRRVALTSILVVAVGLIVTVVLVRGHERRVAKRAAEAEELRRNKIVYPLEDVLLIVREAADQPSLHKGLRCRYEPWISSYRRVLERLIALGYAIRSVDDFDPAKLGEKIIYLRHDIHDRDISGAACMMDLENNLGAGATYL